MSRRQRDPPIDASSPVMFCRPRQAGTLAPIYCDAALSRANEIPVDLDQAREAPATKGFSLIREPMPRPRAVRMSTSRPILFWTAIFTATTAAVVLLHQVLLPFVAGMMLAYLLFICLLIAVPLASAIGVLPRFALRSYHASSFYTAAAASRCLTLDGRRVSGVGPVLRSDVRRRRRGECATGFHLLLKQVNVPTSCWIIIAISSQVVEAYLGVLCNVC